MRIVITCVNNLLIKDNLPRKLPLESVLWICTYFIECLLGENPVYNLFINFPAFCFFIACHLLCELFRLLPVWTFSVQVDQSGKCSWGLFSCIRLADVWNKPVHIRAILCSTSQLLHANRNLSMQVKYTPSTLCQAAVWPKKCMVSCTGTFNCFFLFGQLFRKA